MWAVLGTGIAIAAAAGVLWLGRRLRERAKRWIQRTEAAASQGSVRHLLTGVRIVGDWLLRILVAIALFLVAEEWLRFVLGQFGFTRPWADAMTGWMLDLLRGWGHSIAGALPGLFAAILIFLLARLLTHTVSLTFRGVAKTSRFDQGEPFSESWRMERVNGDNQPWLVAGIRQNG